ncbi:MAG TPA: hypothetical protein VGQ57_13960, partial [Polyangiaceae bacterium]|nr:hypothetical protein [Polyangiaceae bacterium]
MAAGRASKFSLGLGFLWLGCGGSPRGAALAPASVHPAPGGQGKASTAPVTLAPARVFPPTERTEVSLEVFDPDGSRRLIAQGVRLIERPGGALELADELLPASRVLTPVALPPQLGGGWIFAVNAGGAGLLWHAPAWTAKLRALARLEGEIERVVPGFDRLYVLRARGAPWVA